MTLGREITPVYELRIQQLQGPLEASNFIDALTNKVYGKGLKKEVKTTCTKTVILTNNDAYYFCQCYRT